MLDLHLKEEKNYYQFHKFKYKIQQRKVNTIIQDLQKIYQNLK